jgi:hypothetical protein
MQTLEASVIESGSPWTARQIELPMTFAVCAWCKPAPAGEGFAVWSHGICPRHLRRMRLDLQKKPRKSRKVATPSGGHVSAN